MSNHDQIIAKAKDQLDKLGNELDELDHKVKSECQSANAWFGEQMIKLRSEWRDAQTNIERLQAEGRSQAETAYETAADEADRHWKALQAAVQTYRQQIEQSAAKDERS